MQKSRNKNYKNPETKIQEQNLQNLGTKVTKNLGNKITKSENKKYKKSGTKSYKNLGTKIHEQKFQKFRNKS
jgi:hypothetical protein